MRPGSVFAVAGVLLAALAAVFAFDGLRAADDLLGFMLFTVAAAGGLAAALWLASLLQRHGPLPGRIPLLLLVTVPLWGDVPARGRAAISGAYAGYFGGLFVLLARRARGRRV
jgi:hypothetical protein